MEIMEKLIEASRAGVKIEMVIRGICCLCPGVEGYSDNIRIKSIVGRYLEHSRIFIFGADEDTQRIFMGSGDLLNRNTRRRVEVFTEVKSADARRDIKRLVDAIRMDNQNSWQMLADGSYLKDTSDHAEPLDSHKYLHEYFEKPLELPAKKHSCEKDCSSTSIINKIYFTLLQTEFCSFGLFFYFFSHILNFYFL